MGSDYPRGTCENVVYHFHGTIQIIIPSYLRPVVRNYKHNGLHSPVAETVTGVHAKYLGIVLLLLSRDPM